jgi:hypothetical protein
VPCSVCSPPPLSAYLGQLKDEKGGRRREANIRRCYRRYNECAAQPLTHTCVHTLSCNAAQASRTSTRNTTATVACTYIPSVIHHPSRGPVWMYATLACSARWANLTHREIYTKNPRKSIKREKGGRSRFDLCWAAIRHNPEPSACHVRMESGLARLYVATHQISPAHSALPIGQCAKVPYSTRQRHPAQLRHITRP